MTQRPWWMTGLFWFCLFMTFVYLPYDFVWKWVTRPIDTAQEVWLGFLLTGWAAKATEPLHWAIYAAGAYGFWKMRPWLHPWAALYCGSIALGMLIWGVRDERANALYVGLAGFVPFAALTLALWRARDLFARQTVQRVAISDSSRRWIDAGVLLGTDPTRRVLCPDCERSHLEVQDLNGPGAPDVTERIMRCPGCGAWNAMRKRRPA